MQELEQVTKTVVKTTHHFYCDMCHTYLGSSQEYDDGYYAELGKFDLSFCLPDSWYESNKCLCDACKQEYLEDIYESLKTLGFVKR